MNTEQHLPPCSTQRIDASLVKMPVVSATFLVRVCSAFISTSSPSQRRHILTHALLTSDYYSPWTSLAAFSNEYYICHWCVFTISVCSTHMVLCTIMSFQIIHLSPFTSYCVSSNHNSFFSSYLKMYLPVPCVLSLFYVNNLAFPIPFFGILSFRCLLTKRNYCFHDRRLIYNLTFLYGALSLALCNCNGLVAPRLSFVQCLVLFDSVCFCVLDVFPVARLHTVRLVRRMQFQFTWSW